jgi:predicted HAD superfamily Cof-like phosphohydrolase
MLEDRIHGARLLIAPNCPNCKDGKLLPYIDGAVPDVSNLWGVKCTDCNQVFRKLDGQKEDIFLGMNRHPNQTKHQFRVELLMRCAKQAVPLKPVLPDLKVRHLRAKLILEEALETINALGFKAEVYEDGDTYLTRNDETISLEGIADGCADISVVTIGALSACGIQDNPILEEVDGNNLLKFGPEAILNGAHWNADGKWVKPKNHPAPRISEVLEKLK